MPGRKVQLKMMEAEVEKLQAVSSKGDMAWIARGHRALKNQLGAYLKDLEADKDGEMVSTDPTGAWYRAAMALTKEGGHPGPTAEDHGEGGEPERARRQS